MGFKGQGEHGYDRESVSYGAMSVPELGQPSPSSLPAANLAVSANIVSQIEIQRSPWPTPPEWRYVVGKDEFDLLYLNITLPNR